MRRSLQCSIMAILAALLCLHKAQARTETHTNLQSVTAMGASAWAGAFPFKIRGVILNDPEEMLDMAWDPEAESLNRMGAQYQIFIQAAEAGDRGGTALWMGQNYSSIAPPFAGHFYSEAPWSNEMRRVNYDTNASHRFRAGDLVEVTANQSLFYGGKRNVNEAHRTTEANKFHVALIEAGRGLPDPEVAALADLVTEGTNQISTRRDSRAASFIRARGFAWRG